MVDKDAIFAAIDQYVKLSNGATVTIDEQGLVSIIGNCDIVSQLDQLPIRFLSVAGNFYCAHNQLTSLDGAPHTVDGYFNCYNNPLISLKGAPKSIKGEISLAYSPSLPLLQLFKIANVPIVKIQNTKTKKWDHPVGIIINRYLHLGIDGVLPCAAMLRKMGYSGNARL